MRFLIVFFALCSMNAANEIDINDLSKNVSNYQDLLKDKLAELEKAQSSEPVAKPTSSGINTAFLFASLIWGSIGTGYFIYGKKSQKPLALVGGLVLIAASYFCGPLMMSVVGVGVMVGVYKTH
ncbi:MAG: hypothetical protein KC646_01020 [Candidatus Cloacimonetes bacterium]|nr:hypothetical protein [Candidatus Cloacimonadota bacterium]